MKVIYLLFLSPRILTMDYVIITLIRTSVNHPQLAVLGSRFRKGNTYHHFEIVKMDLISGIIKEIDLGGHRQRGVSKREFWLRN